MIIKWFPVAGVQCLSPDTGLAAVLLYSAASLPASPATVSLGSICDSCHEGSIKDLSGLAISITQLIGSYKQPVSQAQRLNEWESAPWRSSSTLSVAVWLSRGEHVNRIKTQWNPVQQNIVPSLVCWVKSSELWSPGCPTPPTTTRGTGWASTPGTARRSGCSITPGWRPTRQTGPATARAWGHRASTTTAPPTATGATTRRTSSPGACTRRT